MKIRKLFPLFLSCQLVWSCGPKEGPDLGGLTSTRQALSAKPIDPDTEVFRLHDGSDNYFPLLKTGRQLFILDCPQEENGLLREKEVIEAIGYPYEDHYLLDENMIDVTDVEMRELLDGLGYGSIQNVPSIRCEDANTGDMGLLVATFDFEGDTDYEELSVGETQFDDDNNPVHTEDTDEDDEIKYFLEIWGEGHSVGRRSKAYMLGCTQLIDALGLDRDFAEVVIPRYALVDDEYDIHCYNGTVTQMATCTGNIPPHAVWTTNHGEVVDSNEMYTQKWDAAQRLWLPKPSECEWDCKSGYIKDGDTCITACEPPFSSKLSEEICGCNENGKKKLFCDVDGRWVLTNECEDHDECCEGEDRLLNSSICGANNDDALRERCVKNEDGSRWFLQDYCVNPDNCVYNTMLQNPSVPCGKNGNGWLWRVCPGKGQENAGHISDDAWQCSSAQVCEAMGWICSDPDECKNGEPPQVLENSCGYNGRDSETRACIYDGEKWKWDFWKCDRKEKCTDGHVQEVDESMNLPLTCGLNGRGTPSAICVNGDWETITDVCDDHGEVCVDGDKQGAGSCGINGRGYSYQRCVAGFWSDQTSCYDPDECKDGDSYAESCGIYEERATVCRKGKWKVGDCESLTCNKGYHCYPWCVPNNQPCNIQ